MIREDIQTYNLSLGDASSNRTLDELKAELIVFEKYGTQAPIALINAIRKAENEEQIEFINNLCCEMEDKLDQLSLNIKSKMTLKLAYDPEFGLSIYDKIIEKESGLFSKYFKSIFSSNKVEKESFVKEEIFHYRNKLEVVFDDGIVICEKNVKETMVKTIRKLGIRNVINLNMYCRNLPLISRVLENTNAQVEIENGYFLMTYRTLDRKKGQLEEIAERLNEPISVRVI